MILIFAGNRVCEKVFDTPDGKPMPQGYTKEETNKRDLAGFLAHMVQETGDKGKKR